MQLRGRKYRRQARATKRRCETLGFIRDLEVRKPQLRCLHEDSMVGVAISHAHTKLPRCKPLAGPGLNLADVGWGGVLEFDEISSLILALRGGPWW
jgi:hypothetical protein